MVVSPALFRRASPVDLLANAKADVCFTKLLLANVPADAYAPPPHIELPP